MADVSILLTTLWYEETTDVTGNPYTPEPDVYCISYRPVANGQDIEGCELARRIYDHNSWADKQEGRARVKQTKQQVVVMTKPVEQEPEDNWHKDNDWGVSLADRYYEELAYEQQTRVTIMV